MKKLLGYSQWSYDPSIHGGNDRWWKAAIYRHGVPAVLIMGMVAGIAITLFSHF
jgi:hypothetical protein